MEPFSNDTADWIETRLDGEGPIELEIGSLVAAASAWTEDEGELDDLVSGLVETGRIELQIG